MTLTRSYGVIAVNPDGPLIRPLEAAIRRVGVEPRLLPTGGSDANILNDSSSYCCSFDVLAAVKE